MTYELHDLSERLREKARAKLKKELYDLAQPFMNRIRLGYSFHTGLLNKEGQSVTAWQAVEMIANAVFEIQVKEREQTEIDEFIEKAESLQEQIDQLARAAQQ